MTLEELYSVQRDSNKLKSLCNELANHEGFNPYKKSIISDMPRGNRGKSTQEWYIEEKERLEAAIAYYQKKVAENRIRVEEFLRNVPYPEGDIIRYRVINNMGWFEIGEVLSMDRRTASRKFHRYMNLPAMPIQR